MPIHIYLKVAAMSSLAKATKDDLLMLCDLAGAEAKESDTKANIVSSLIATMKAAKKVLYLNKKGGVIHE